MERLLLDSMADEAYILQTLRGIDDETPCGSCEGAGQHRRSEQASRAAADSCDQLAIRAGVVGELADSARAPREESLRATFRASCAKTTKKLQREAAHAKRRKQASGARQERPARLSGR